MLRNRETIEAFEAAISPLEEVIECQRMFGDPDYLIRVAVARLGSGRLVVVADECPHDGGRISDGFVDGERLICARHGWELEARDGRCERACKLRE